MTRKMEQDSDRAMENQENEEIEALSVSRTKNTYIETHKQRLHITREQDSHRAVEKQENEEVGALLVSRTKKTYIQQIISSA